VTSYCSRSIVLFAQHGGQRANHAFGGGARVEFPGFRVAEHTVRLKVTVTRICGSNFRNERVGISQFSRSRGGRQCQLQIVGKVERDAHRDSKPERARHGQA
jgi:hypothetical protein